MPHFFLLLIRKIVKKVKYYIFILKYFEEPLTILTMQTKKEVYQAKLRNGGIFDTLGYGNVSSNLFRIWGNYEYGIRPKDAKKFRVVIDIGAHIGLFSVFLGILNPQCKIYCFEINQDNFNKLNQNIKNCRVKNVLPFNLAVTNKSQLIEFYSGRDSSEFSTTRISFSDEKPFVDVKLNPTGIIESITLNKIIEMNNIECIDFLKLDCEGAEFEILETTNETNLKKINEMGGEYHEYENYTIDYLNTILCRYGVLKKIEIRKGIGLMHYKKKENHIKKHSVEQF